MPVGSFETEMPAEARDLAMTQGLMSLSATRSPLTSEGVLTPSVYIISARAAMGDTYTINIIIIITLYFYYQSAPLTASVIPAVATKCSVVSPSVCPYACHTRAPA